MKGSDNKMNIDSMLDDINLDLYSENEDINSDEEEKKELEKKKKSVAKKIAALLVLIAGITAVIVICKKNKDKQGEKVITDVQKNLNKRTLKARANLNRAKTEEEVNTVEEEIERIEEVANEAKRYKVRSIYRDIDGNKQYRLKRKADSVSKMDFMNNDGLDGYQNDLFLLYIKSAEDAASKGDGKNARIYNFLADKAATNLYVRGKKLDSLLKARHESSDEYLHDAIKYSYMIEEVCERLDKDFINYESANELIDAIYEKCI